MNHSMDFPHFPPGFVWGAATAAYQIEGGVRDAYRGESIWDRFSHTPGKTLQGQTGDVACDHFHRWRQDVALMAELGLQAYRFSIAWPRIQPQGRGTVNQVGLDFYDQLVDGLLRHNIQPFITLYHWDLPQALQDLGGWSNRDLVGYFTDYAVAVARRLADRVRHWITFNEPHVFAFMGHFSGEHAPGLKDLTAALQTAHHTLLAHGEAYRAMRANTPSGTRVGITLDLYHVDAVSDSLADVEAARRYDGHLNRWFLEPLFSGRYPEDMIDLYQGYGPQGDLDDLGGLPGTVDFLGINNYFRQVVGYRKDPPFDVAIHQPQGNRYTEMGWEVYPTGLYELLLRVQRDYAPPAVYITENGAAFADVLQPDGVVDDPERIEFLSAYTRAASRALDEGVPLKGYFVWTLMDNFEWALGYSKRFGLVYVDYPTQERIVKRSGHWYREMIAGQG
ncbi:MAG: GH1 family beta-glucosidase [Chloroflexota bacterium]